MSAKSWTFTLNNYTEEDCDLLDNIECTYMVYGKEVGESGTPHIQGFVTFKNSTRLAALKKILPRAHLEVAKATEAAANYCMKEQNYVIRDNRVQGKRNDLEKYAETIRLSGVKRAVEDQPVCALKYPGGTKFLARMFFTERNWHVAPNVIWLYGEAGAGKTRWVFETYPEIYVKNCSKGNKWFDGYTQQAVCLLDDLRQDTFDWNFLLQLLDRYPLMVEIKGEMVPFNSPIIIITSPKRPEHTFINNGEDIAQLLRRIQDTREVGMV